MERIPMLDHFLFILISLLLGDIRHKIASTGFNHFSGNRVLQRNGLLPVLFQVGVRPERDHLLRCRIVDPHRGPLRSQIIDRVPGDGLEDFPLAERGIDVEDRIDLTDQKVYIMEEHSLFNLVDDGGHFLQREGAARRL